MTSGDSPAWLASSLRCANCAAPVVLDERAAVLECRHCGERTVLERGDAAVWHEFRPGEAREPSQASPDGPSTLTCVHCGAAMRRRPGALTTQCQYCLSNLAAADPSAHEAFDAIVPFGLDGAVARQHFINWLGDTWLAPSDLARAAKLEELDSIYVPGHAWRARAKTRWRARVGILTTAAEDEAAGHIRPSGDAGHVRTRWEDREGIIEEPISELESASRVITTKELSELGGFEQSDAVRYHQAYLGTHDAELPVHASGQSYERMMARVTEVRANLAESGIDAERHKNFQAETRLSEVENRLVLVPVYVVAYRYEKGTFRVLVNGRSGAVCGDHPLSPWKVGALLVVLLGLGLLVVLAFG